MGLSQISVYFPYGNGDGRIYDVYYVRGIDSIDGSL